MKKPQIVNINSTNDFKVLPYAPISRRVYEWYNNEDTKFLIFTMKNKKEFISAYNTVYALTKRRHNLNVKRYQRGNDLIIERL